MSRLSIVFGVLAAAILLVYYSPQDLMQASIENIEIAESEEILKEILADPAEAETEPVGEPVVAPAEPEPASSRTYFNSYMSSKRIFEKAYGKVYDAGDVDPLDNDSYAGILPHHLMFPEYIAEYFEKLAETQHIDTFVVIGPNHFDRGKKSIAVSEYGYTTPYGHLEPDSQMIDYLLDGSYLGWDVSAFDQEHSVSSLVPFIKKSFPNAEIVPITLKLRTSQSSLDELVEDLVELSGPGVFVLGSIDFSHMMNWYVAQFHDELSRTVIETLDFDAIDEVEIDSPPTLYTVMKYASEIGAEDVEIVNHSNSAEKLNGEDYINETTSHFYIAFGDGDVEVERDVTIMALGDMMMGRYVRMLMELENDNEYAFQKIRGDEDRFFQGADMFFGNLEGPIKGEGYKSGTSVIFGFHEDTASLLAKMGFDLLSIANNHILNQGWEGFDSTLGALSEVGVGACGHPTEVTPYNSVVYRSYGDREVAFFCFEDVSNRLDLDAAVELISSVSPEVDFSVVSIHWGFEYVHTPSNSRQVVPAHKFVDAGADLIIGHHPHVVQTFEIYNGASIFYSLGNFIFDQYWSYDTEEQLGVGVVLGGSEADDGELGVERFYLFPMHSERSQPYLMDHDERQKFYDRLVGWGKYDEEMAEMIRGGVVEIK